MSTETDIQPLEHIAHERKNRLIHALDAQTETVAQEARRWSASSDEIIASPVGHVEQTLASRLSQYPPDVLAFRDQVMAPMTQASAEKAVVIAREAINTLLEQPNADELLLKMFATEPGMDTVNQRMQTIIDRLVDEDVPADKREMAKQMLRSFMSSNSSSDLLLDSAGNSLKTVQMAKEEFEQAQETQQPLERSQLEAIHRDGIALNIASQIIDRVQSEVLSDGYGKTEKQKDVIEKATEAADSTIAESQAHVQERKSRLEVGISILRGLIAKLRSNEN
ncbi:MAG: hypothetical protein RI947_301 [Candidatus Parcubacteria bacterium]|jgi:hypothetical protein